MPMPSMSSNLGAISYEMVKSFMTFSTDGIVIVDLEGRVLDVNPAFERLHGWTREEVIGTILPMTPPHLVDEAKKMHTEIMEGNSVGGFETLKLRKDGTMFYASVSISPVKDQQGKIIALVGVERDITAQKEAEKQLLESELNYRQLVELSPEPIVVIDEASITYANPAAIAMVGAEQLDRLTGRRFLDFVHHSQAAEVRQLVQESLESLKPSSIVSIRLVRTDKLPLDVELKVVPFRTSDKMAAQLLFRDITNQLKAEESLQEAENLYEQLVENAMVGVGLYQRQKIIYVNPYLADMYGYTIEEFINLKPNEIVVEDDLKLLYDKTRRMLHGGSSRYRFSVRGIKKDGSLLDLEGLVTYITYKGKPALLGAVQDVTYQRKIEETLLESAKRYQRLIKFLPESIIVIDKGMVIYANKSAMKLVRIREEGDLIGKSVFSVIHPDFHDQMRQTIFSIMETDEATSFEKRTIICSDGELLEVEMSCIRIHNFMGKTVMLTVLRDLTDRKRAEEMLIRSEKLSVIGQLAAGLAHEIRNPLTSLKGFNQLLKSKYAGESSYFDLMLTELERINLIVNDFMTLAKPQLSQFSYGSVESILQSVVSILSHQAILMNVNLRLEAACRLPDVYRDENQLKQVFINLIKNALEAMPQGGDVTVSADLADEKRVRIRIRDQGEGIPAALITRLGEPFFTTKENGTGLGLMISYRIIENHGGTISITSRAGEGTTVEIMLPVSVS